MSGQLSNPPGKARPDPSDPVYVLKAELPIDGSSPIEAVFRTACQQRGWQACVLARI